MSSIEFKKLNGLTPTVESCTMKLLEEVGELMQLIGKGQGKSGESKVLPERFRQERMIQEAFDVAQSAVTMIFALAERHGSDIETWVMSHETKLRERGYLK